uniref:Uncharacterized protein n=1 Tax=Triticum aestivum TaxID=4565 RepID=A0A077RS52_WHEAT|nr:unnamed protein product [Triticum aestivum]
MGAHRSGHVPRGQSEELSGYPCNGHGRRRFLATAKYLTRANERGNWGRQEEFTASEGGMEGEEYNSGRSRDINMYHAFPNFYGIAFSGNFNLQNLLILTAIKADSSRVMDYVNRLDNFHGPAIGELAVEAQLYEEAFALFKKFNLNVHDVDVLLDNI